ncbi:MAG: GNAT family N-acetyltransferase [Myxococcota bacterium]
MSVGPHAPGPANGLSRLRPRDRRSVLNLLVPHAAQNAYILAQISRGALGRDDLAGPLLGHWSEGLLTGVAIFGSNLVLSTPCTPSARDAFARYARAEGFRVWVVVGEDATIDAFMATYGRQTRPTLLERPGQKLYAMHTAPDLSGQVQGLRPAEIQETEALMRLDREMVVEELGFDPFSRDLESYRRGWKRRIREGRSWIIERHGEALFKVDQSASSEHVIQLAGVYTAPSARRQGLAREGMAGMVAWALERVPVVTLYVDASNHAAIRLYEALGFQEKSLVRSIWFAS